MTAIALMNQGASKFQPAEPARLVVFVIAAFATAILLIAGLWTPIAGFLVVLVELWAALLEPGDHWIHILLGTMGAGLALVGPGVWSLDARLFGWKRIGSRQQKS